MSRRFTCAWMLVLLALIFITGCGDEEPAASELAARSVTPSIPNSTPTLVLTATSSSSIDLSPSDSGMLTLAESTATPGPPQVISPKNAARLQIMHHLELPHSMGLNRFVFTQEGDLVAQGDYNNTTQLWSSIIGFTGATHFSPLRSYQAVRSLLAPDARSVTVANPKGKVSILHLPTGAISETIQFDRPKEHWQTLPIPIAVSPNNQLLATLSADAYKMRVWRMDTGNLAYTLVHNTGDQGSVDAASFSPDGQMLATVSRDGIVWLWKATDGTKIRDWSTPLNEWESARLAFSPDGKKLVTAATRTGVITLWSTDGSSSRTVSSGQQGQIFHLTFSPNGKLLAGAGDRDTVYLWDVEKGTLVGSVAQSRWFGPSANVAAMAFSPDGKILAVGLETTKVGDTTSDSVDLWVVR